MEVHKVQADQSDLVNWHLDCYMQLSLGGRVLNSPVVVRNIYSLVLTFVGFLCMQNDVGNFKSAW